ncbi:MAG: AMMECR1 domain-containing protein [Phycisphaerae bacterium]|nr:AMMECR1 domain-containing protein [Phycisphaerae bacterium]
MTSIYSAPMRGYKEIHRLLMPPTIAVLIGLAGCPALASTEGDRGAEPETSPPQLSSADQTRLIRSIRRTVTALVSGSRPSGVEPPAPALAGLKCPVHVTLRRGGYVLAAGQADGRAGLVEACRDAAIDAVKNGLDEARLDESALKRLAVEVELLGPAQQLPVGLLRPRALERQYEPGLDGIAVRLGDRSALLRPSQIIAFGLSTSQAIEFVVRQLGLAPEDLRRQKERVLCLRFRTRHFWQARAEDPVVELHRGCAIVPQESVTRGRIDQAIDQIACHLVERQRPDGSFSGGYLPWSNEEAGAGSAIVDAGAAWALAMVGAARKDRSAMDASARTLAALTKQLAPIEGKEGAGGEAAYLKSPVQADRLGASAMLLLTACEPSPVEPNRQLCDRLARGIMTRQLPTGMMQTNFVTTQPAAPQDVNPGQALLALAAYQKIAASPKILAAIERGFEHYSKEFSLKPSDALMPWLAGACARMAGDRRDSRYAKHLFEMMDWLEPHQLTSRNCRWPEMLGGIDPQGTEQADIGTALQMMAVADALALARRFGDKQRSARYERMLRHGMRFVLQLEFRPEECLYVRWRLETIHGVRTAPWDHALTTENAQFALVALVKARELLAP